MYFHGFSFSCQHSTVVPTPGPSTLLNQEFLSIPCSFFPSVRIYHSQSSSCLCVASFKLMMKKESESPTPCVFAVVYTHGERMCEEGKSRNRIIHVGFLYTLRGSTYRSTLSEFLIIPVRGLCRPAFLFQLLVSPLKQKSHQERDQEWHRKCDFSSKLELFDCRWSPTALVNH